VKNKETIFEFVDTLSFCPECQSPTMALEYCGYVLLGCDTHMIELGNLLRDTLYYRWYTKYTETLNERLN